jgi:branched-chain amino acid transport system substrate-binding protein
MEEIKMKIKKLSALLLSLAMVASMTACGSEATSSVAEATGSEAAASTAETTDTAADAATTTETEAPAGSFKLGGIGPLTGAAAIYGTAAMNGAQIAVDEINALGGDITFEFNAQDDVHDAETSVNAYHTLQDWGMQVLVGTVTTAPCIAVSAEAYTDRVFCLTPSASSTDVIADKDNMYQVCFTDPNQGTGAADYIAENISGTIAVIYQNDDAYSQGIRDTFVAEAAEKGLDVVYEGTFTADTATDFSVQLTAAQAAGAEIIFLPMYYTPASVILKQADSMGYAPTFFGVDGMDGILTMEGFDTSLAEGVMLLTPFSADATDDLTQNFVSKYQELYGETPNQFAADGYDAVYTIYEALQAAGCTSDMSAADICEALIAVMPTITVDGLTGEGMTWSSTGEVSKSPRAVVIKDGVYVTP